MRQQKCYRLDLVPLIGLNLSVNILDGREFKVNTIKLLIAKCGDEFPYEHSFNFEINACFIIRYLGTMK